MNKIFIFLLASLALTEECIACTYIGTECLGGVLRSGAGHSEGKYMKEAKKES